MKINKIKAAIIKELVENYYWDLDRNAPSITKRGDHFIIKSVGVFCDNVDEFYYDTNDGNFYLKTWANLKKYSFYPKFFDSKEALIRK